MTRFTRARIVAVALAALGLWAIPGNALAATGQPELTFRNSRNPTFVYQNLDILKGASATDSDGNDISSSIVLVASQVPTTTINGATVASESGSFPITLSVTDAQLNTTTLDFTMVVNPPSWRGVSATVERGSNPPPSDFVDLGNSTYHPELYTYRWITPADFFDTPGTRVHGIAVHDAHKGAEIHIFWVDITVTGDTVTNPVPNPPGEAEPPDDGKPEQPTETIQPETNDTTKKFVPGRTTPQLHILPDQRDTTRGGLFITRPGESPRPLTPKDIGVLTRDGAGTGIFQPVPIDGSTSTGDKAAVGDAGSR